MDRIRGVKAIMMEPRASEKENFDDIMRQFYDIIKNCQANGLMHISVFSSRIYVLLYWNSIVRPSFLSSVIASFLFSYEPFSLELLVVRRDLP